MKALKFTLYIIGFAAWGFIACRENKHDNDTTSTITPGNKLEADSATAHANNSFDTLAAKNKDNTPNADKTNAGK